MKIWGMGSSNTFRIKEMLSILSWEAGNSDIELRKIGEKKKVMDFPPSVLDIIHLR